MQPGSFEGYHSEWNLGSPGGWDYQRMTQELGKLMWKELQKRTNIDIQLDFDHPLLDPTRGFIEALLEVHRRNFGTSEAHVAIVAEEETLDAVIENRNIVSRLNAIAGVRSSLAAPHHLKQRADGVYIGSRQVTSVFVDFNNDVLLNLARQYDLSGLLQAVRQNIVMNPRGTAPINSKGIFELVGTELADRLTSSTTKRTPWTRRFRPRSTLGPDGSSISDLVEWTRQYRDRLVLKPEEGYSGKGVFAGWQSSDWDANIETALEKGDYIVQDKVPLNLWAEEQPWLDIDNKTLDMKVWQTDFRCLITNRGLTGFVARFGGVPTNVGSGGGVQCLAVLNDQRSVRDAVATINRSLLELGFGTVQELKQMIDEKAVEYGLVYLLGPIMTALRPRLLTTSQIADLHSYADNLWNDTVYLENLWRTGELDHFISIDSDHEELARTQPWGGSPALIASDGLFDFGASVRDSRQG